MRSALSGQGYGLTLPDGRVLTGATSQPDDLDAAVRWSDHARNLERAARLGTIVQMHVAEVPEENEHVRRTRGTTTVRHLARLGVLGPAFLSVHVVWVDDDELDLDEMPAPGDDAVEFVADDEV